MNLVPLERRGDVLVVRGTDGPPIAPARSGNVEAGLRPEALRIAAHGIRVRALNAEYLGADTILACEPSPSITILARLPGRTAIAPGDFVQLDYEPSALSLFDAASGRRVPMPPCKPPDTETAMLDRRTLLAAAGAARRALRRSRASRNDNRVPVPRRRRRADHEARRRLRRGLHAREPGCRREADLCRQLCRHADQGR